MTTLITRLIGRPSPAIVPATVRATAWAAMLGIALAASPSAGAQATAKAQASAEASIIATERGALDRWGKGDPQGYLEIYAPEITYFDPLQERRLDGIEAMKKLLLPLTGKIKVDRYDMIKPKVQLYGDVAVLSYNLISHVTAADGKPGTVQWNSSVVFVRQGDHWRSVHSHWSYIRPLGDRGTP